MRNWQNDNSPGTNSFPEGLFELFHSYSSGILLNSDSSGNGTFEWMLGSGSIKEFKGGEEKNVFEEFQNFLDMHRDWIFGHFSYDLKNALESLESTHTSGIEFPALYFFIPEIIAIQSGGNLKTCFPDKKTENDFLLLVKNNPEKKKYPNKTINLRARTSKPEYIQRVNSILTHIHRGDIYEINYCIEFFGERVSIDPIEVFKRLTELTDAPFSVLYKNNDQWLLCGSPERFMQKKGNKIISQPIKGTRPRGNTVEEDLRLKNELLADQKERSENVMIVDLVRNDLSRSAKKGSVQVDELFGIHTFKNVHQMISSVSASLDENKHPVEAIKNAFPMGSMTGAPKVRAMQLTEEFEQTRRGLYAGAVGYFTPEMDFDFNVVIRSIQYNSKTGYLSLMVGSAITANSDPEKEYEECLLKARTLFEALGLDVKHE